MEWIDEQTVAWTEFDTFDRGCTTFRRTTAMRADHPPADLRIAD
jgi:hypothetical protein